MKRYLNIWVIEMAAFLCVMIYLNLPMINGKAVDSHVLFYPQKVIHGEWWRMFTGPFVHVSVYHLILDGAAFLILYAFLRHVHVVERLAVLSGAFVGSMWLAWLMAPEISGIGLCGLSGVAHGLMAVAGIYMFKQGEKNKGLLILFVIIAKSVFECMTGQVIFMAVHRSECGIPVAGSHGGGVLGALAVFTILNLKLIRCPGEIRWKNA